jgi:ribosomal protein S18 acetylase RimI-like enzyme
VILPPAPLIRAATEADSAAIGRVHVAAWRETYRGLIPDQVLAALSAEQRTQQWRSGLARGTQGPIVFVAEDPQGALIGFAAAGAAREPDRNWQAEITALYILQNSQRQGIGTALLRRLSTALQENGRRAVGLWVLTANAGARAFYESIGGRPVGQKTDQSDGWPCHETAYFWEDFPRAPEA